MSSKRALPLLAILCVVASACSSGHGSAVPPGAPTAVVASTGVRSATVTWTPPASDGGSAITAYTVLPSPAAPFSNVVISGTSATLTGLVNGTPYTFSVAAKNEAGVGPASAPSDAIVTPDVPAAPLGVVVVAGDRSATVSWNAPVLDGGAPITGYVVTMAPAVASAGISIQGAVAIVTGLANGTAYAFRVQATNAVGDGPLSAPSSAVTPAPLGSISLGPSPVSVPLGGSRQLLVSGSYGGGGQRDLTSQAQWASSNPGAATVSGGS